MSKLGTTNALTDRLGAGDRRRRRSETAAAALGSCVVGRHASWMGCSTLLTRIPARACLLLIALKVVAHAVDRIKSLSCV